MKNPQPVNFPRPEKKYDSQKTIATLSYRIKGIIVGILGVYIFCYFYVGDYPPKYIIAGGILGYFLGWVAGNFFYTKKD